MLGAVASATMVGDMHMAAGGGPIVTTPQGERYEGSVRDEVLMAPNIAGAGAASATAPATDTSKLENKQNSVVSLVFPLSNTSSVEVRKLKLGEVKNLFLWMK